MKSKFLANLFLLIALNVLVKPFWLLGIDRTIQNVVGAAEYGLYFSLFNFSIILNILLDFGITSFNNRDIARHKHLLVKNISNLVTAKLFLGLVFFIISIFIAWLVGYELYQLNLLLVLLLNQFINSFILYLRSNINGLHLFKTDSILSVLDRLLLIFLCSVLLWGNITKAGFQIEWLVYSQTVSYLITLLVVSVIVISKTGFIKPRFDYRQIISFLKRSVPFALLGLLMSLYTRIDSVMLERMLVDGKLQTGIYAQAFRLMDAGSMIGYLFAILLLPIFSQMIKNKKAVGQLLRLAFFLIIIPTLTIAIAALFHNYSIIEILYHNHVEESGIILSVLMFGLIFISSGYIFGTLLTANGNLKELNIISGISVCINVILNLILIPRYQALGAAIASLISLAFVSVLQIIMVKNFFNEDFDLKLKDLIIFSAGLILFAAILNAFTLEWYFSFLLIIIFAVILSYVMNLISIKKVLEFFSFNSFIREI